jgi:UDP-2,3-diacylglucosamine pyrophosphatase LpxH
LKPDTETLHIIHLADFHMKNDPVHADRLEIIVESLLDSLDKIDTHNLGENLEEGRLVFAVTGDLSQTGKKEQFDLFEKKVHNQLKRFKKNVTIVYSPGNHDFDMDADQAPTNSRLLNDLMDENNQVQLNSARKTISDYFKGVSGAYHLKNAMLNYYHFVNKANPGQIKGYEDGLHNILEFPFGGCQFFFVSLNSAYLRSDLHEYQGFIGVPQIDLAFNVISNKKLRREQIYSCTLFHHPFDAIVPVSQYETYRSVIKWSDFVLTGHVHYLKVYSDLAMGNFAFRESGGYPLLSHARCVYGEMGQDVDAPGFSVISLDVEDGKVVGMQITWMIYDYKTESWILDQGVKHNPLKIPPPPDSGPI